MMHRVSAIVALSSVVAGEMFPSKNVIVRLKAQSSEVLASSDSLHPTRHAVRKSLRTHTDASQQDVLQFLNENGAEFRSFWIDNSIAVSDVSLSLLAALRSHADVLSVEPEISVRLTTFLKDNPSVESMSNGPQGNIAELRVEDLWAQGIRGQGVVVANIDSGVRWTHEALRANYRGFADSQDTVNHDYAMWDSQSHVYTPENVDIFGHGSHTMGTLVGSGPKGIGMAPNATWISAKAFDWQGSATESDILAAAQWVMCPTKYDHTGEDCSKGADIVSCSFGGNATTTWLNPVVKAWRAAGMLPVFASGNADNAMTCGTVLEPAGCDDAIAVGGLAAFSTLYRASGKGPGLNGKIIKPDFVAPAVSINSICTAADTGNSGYMRLTGTSMATPHVAGAFALLLSGIRRTQPNATVGIADAVAALRATTSRAMKRPVLAAGSCGDTTWNVFPNNIYGWGEPDVCAAAVSLGVAVSCSGVSAIMA